MWKFWADKRSDINILADRMDAAIAVMSAPPPVQAESETTSERLCSLETEFEHMKLRQEQLTEECLRHLQKASQRMKRAEKLSEDQGLDPDDIPTQNIPQLPFEQQAEQDDRSWAMNMIRERGETPL
jgi:hypothetical protein